MYCDYKGYAVILTMPCVGLQNVIVVFSDHTCLFFVIKISKKYYCKGLLKLSQLIENDECK